MRVQKTKNEQFIITIPKAFAESLELKKGTIIEFKIIGEKEMKICVKK